MKEGQDTVAEALVTSAGDVSRVEGAILHALTTHRDPRGTLTELLRTDWPDEVFGDGMPFAQVYTSTTGPGVARDVDKWHLHQHQTDRFYCIRGRIVVAIADPRDGSPTRDNLMLVELSAAEDGPAPLLVTIPPRTLHGFVVTNDGPATLLNFPTRLYDASDEGRVPFEDAGVTFPDGTPFDYDRVRRWYDERGT
ncbi:MAG TPA: dTDP-4-dehydrorhamnose 3,5-epimerase family protein [Thermomicrobiales bacterium]|nr:dTDP-4-dehydrorhamnose 3,5-epimerase family protein [Thermomicrobiales bacterium]